MLRKSESSGELSLCIMIVLCQVMGRLTESFRQGNSADLLNWLVEEDWFVFEKEEETLSSRGLDEKHMEDGREE